MGYWPCGERREPYPLRMAREGILSGSQKKWCHPRTMLPCQRDSVSLRLPTQPGAWPRPHRTRWRSPTSPQEGGGGGCGRSQPTGSGTLHGRPRPPQRLSGLWDPVGCSPETPSRTPVPECPAGPLPSGLREPRWDPPLRSDPASADAAPFEPAEGGGALGHALSRPRVDMPGSEGGPTQSRSPESPGEGKARSGTYPREPGRCPACAPLQALAQAPCASHWRSGGKASFRNTQVDWSLTLVSLVGENGMVTRFC